MTDLLATSSSWAEMVRTIDQERRKLPWDPSKQEPVKRVSNHERKLAERAFDPVATKFRDESRQSLVDTIRAYHEREKIKSVNESRLNTYNIVSHMGPRRNMDAVYEESLKRTAIVRPYHILTNMSHQDHSTAPFNYDDSYTLDRAGARRTALPNSITNSKRREFNIINNYFTERHDERKRADYEDMKAHLLKKYWQTHDFDLVRGKYYDIEKDSAARKQSKIATEQLTLNKSAKFPPVVKNSEGNAYNILNHQLHSNTQQVRAPGAIDKERAHNRIKSYQINKKMKEQGELLNTFSEKSTLARVSYKRWEQQLDRGFDMVKNKIIVEQAMPLPPRPATMWSRLQTSNSFDRSSGESLTATAAGNIHEDQATATKSFLSTAPEQQLHSSLTRVRHPMSDEVEEIGRKQHQHHLELLKARRSATAAPSGRIRNLSGAGPRLSNTLNYTNNNNAAALSPTGSRITHTDESASQRSVQTFKQFGNAVTMPSSTHAMPNVSAPVSAHSRSQSVPPLDLTLAESAENVSYTEPKGAAAKGQSIAMVRTGGGISGYRD